MEFKVGDRVKYKGEDKRYLGSVGEVVGIFGKELIIVSVDVGKEYPYDFYASDLDFYYETNNILKTKDQLKIEELEERIEKLELYIEQTNEQPIQYKTNIEEIEKQIAKNIVEIKSVMGEQNSLEKRENEPIYERNERFAKILKKELERNAIILNNPKPSLLTEDERVILRNLDKKWKWIARDMEDNNLHIYTLEPTKVIDCWNVAGLDNYENFYIYNHLFQFIKWNDKEPCNIEKLLKGECGNE